MVACALGLAGCVPPPSQSPSAVTASVPPEQDRAVRDDLAPFIGRPLWTNSRAHFNLCPPDNNPCRPAAGKFTVDYVEAVLPFQVARLHMTFAEGASGVIEMRTDVLKMAVMDHDPLIAEAAAPGPLTAKVKVANEHYIAPYIYPGMTKDQVLNSVWGKPKRIKEKSGYKGFREWWYYPKGNVLHFVNGKLVDIEEMKR